MLELIFSNAISLVVYGILAKPWYDMMNGLKSSAQAKYIISHFFISLITLFIAYYYTFTHHPDKQVIYILVVTSVKLFIAGISFLPFSILYQYSKEIIQSKIIDYKRMMGILIVCIISFILYCGITH